jgi:hypothetical protein
MTNFLHSVTEHTRHAGALSLEDKIERLQRRLGGQPLPLEEHLSQIDTDAVIASRLQAMQRQQEATRQKQQGFNLRDPEVQRQFRLEQEAKLRA